MRSYPSRPETLNYYAFYSSFLGGVVTDPALMNIPMDGMLVCGTKSSNDQKLKRLSRSPKLHADHLVHRGHGVFDTATLSNGYVYRLEIHLDRFLESAKNARLVVCGRIYMAFNRQLLQKIRFQTDKDSVFPPPSLNRSIDSRLVLERKCEKLF